MLDIFNYSLTDIFNYSFTEMQREASQVSSSIDTFS